VNVFIWLITIIPYLIPLALIGGVVLLVVRFFKKRKVKKNPADMEQK
jgi:ABC-type multidrug transport system permease subunit